MLQSKILGTGRYLPEKILTNFDLEKMVDTTNDWIVSRTGIEQRHIAAPEEATSDLATEAAKRALKKAGIDASELDLIIVATITPDMNFPATACIVQSNLGSKKAAAFDLEAACTGFLYGITVADQFIKSGMYRYVLVIGAEAMSRILDWTDRNTCVLFGDGAGAAVLGPSTDGSGILASLLGSDGEGGKFLNMPGGGSRLPATHLTVDEKLHSVKMDGSEVFKFAVRVMNTATKEVMDKAGLVESDISYLVPHQANIRIIGGAAKRLNLPLDKVMINLHKYGNISAASVPIALDEALEQGKINAGDTIILVGFGGGLTWGAAAIKW